MFDEPVFGAIVHALYLTRNFMFGHGAIDKASYICSNIKQVDVKTMYVLNTVLVISS